MAAALIHNAKQIKQHRKAGRLAAETLQMIGEHVRPGVTTESLNLIVHEYTVAAGARPAPLNYGGGRGRPPFPKSVCTSINEVICHGIPGPTVLRDGDIVNVDVTSVLPAQGGWYGDTSATFYVGEPSPMARHVVEVARTCLELGMAAAKPGNRLGDIGWAIQQYAEAKGCSVVRDYTGHGIGRTFHGPPSVLHYGRPGRGLKLKPGMTFTIEPMINLGSPEVDHLDDGWTAVTRDRSLSAQFEHTIVLTTEGCEVLTRRDAVLVNSEDKPWVGRLPLSAFTPAGAGSGRSAPV
ncbi:MAG: type I methionyl aminopeptidase [Myxococcota bacterium]|nr:type I methionyl aminopeptidase [Myxococcota bacterium]MEC8424744.1 type I methionyl aminopeptidase [Myxococcota bacterium]